MSFKVDNFSEYLIKAKNGFKTNAQDNSNAPKSAHLKSHLTNLKQSSKDTFTNTASQNAKQDIEKALDAKSIDEVKNILFSKNPEFTKKKLALCAGLLIAYVGIAAIKKPHALKEVIFNLISSAKIKKNRVHFNEEKIFDGPIDLNKMYEKAF